MKRLIIVVFALVIGANAIEKAMGQRPASTAGPMRTRAQQSFARNTNNSKQRELLSSLTDKLRAAENTAQREKITAQLKSILEKDYDQKMQQYEGHLQRLESQLDEMRQQLDRRRQAKDDMVNLRIQTIQAEADNLGWPTGNFGNSGYLAPGFPGSGGSAGGSTSNSLGPVGGSRGMAGSDNTYSAKEPTKDSQRIGSNFKSPIHPFPSRRPTTATAKRADELLDFALQMRIETRQMPTSLQAIKDFALRKKRPVEVTDQWNREFDVTMLEQGTIEMRLDPKSGEVLPVHRITTQWVAKSHGPDGIAGNADDLIFSIPQRKGYSVEEVLTENRLRRILFAMHQYHDINRAFPFSNSTPEDLGWAVRILPFLGEQELYKQFDFAQGWNTQTNRSVAETRPNVLGGDSDYSCFWVASDAKLFADITDGSPNTIAIIAVPNRLLPEETTWAESGGLNPSQIVEICEKLNDNESLTVGLYDGSCRKLEAKFCKTPSFVDCLTVNGNELVQLPE